MYVDLFDDIPFIKGVLLFCPVLNNIINNSNYLSPLCASKKKIVESSLEYLPVKLKDIKYMMNDDNNISKSYLSNKIFQSRKCEDFTVSQMKNSAKIIQKVFNVASVVSIPVKVYGDNQCVLLIALEKENINIDFLSIIAYNFSKYISLSAENMEYKMFAHDINTQLSIIKDSISLQTQENEYIGYARNAVNRAIRIFKNIGKNGLIELESFSICSSVESIINESKILLRQNNITISFSHKGDKYVLLDKTKFEECIINVLYNSIKYTVNGKIDIQTEIIECCNRKNRYLSVSISDTGIGISSDIPFGIGLSIVRKYVIEHNGKLDIKANEIGGTTVNMLFEQ